MSRPIVDIVGHFGTEFSYATVASNVARALDERGLLGIVSNLDPKWHPSHRRIADRTMRGHGTHVLLFTPPHHYLDAYAKTYGRDRSAIFMSPNTDTLADEHAMTCASFSLALCPSSWCRMVVERSVPEIETEVVPLGVDRQLWSEADMIARIERLQTQMPPTVLHLSSDQFWPGRKGTEELLQAWAMGGLGHFARLVVHVPPALSVRATYLIRQLDIDTSVQLVVGGTHGGADALRQAIAEADLLVAPSRCEGFGIMLLSALYAGLPLLSTYNTGHADFLRGLHGGWLGVPTRETAALPGEAGMAPVVEPESLAAALNVAVTPYALLRVLSTNKLRGSEELTWETRALEWADVIETWAKG